jgi:hypothetical protein
MDASTRCESKVVGALPVVVALLEKWKLAECIDQAVPWEGKVPLGTLVEVLVLNRVLNPHAMYEIGDWAVASGVADYYGLTAEQLNDDLLGRGLERLAEHRAVVQSAASLAAVKQWKLKVKQVHYDLSTVELYGAYPGAQPAPDGDPGEGPSPAAFPVVPFPTYGRTKSGRDDVKQVQFGLDVLGDGGVPVALLPLAGNTAEARTHVANLLQLRDLFPRQPFLYLGDSKLDTPENLAAAQETAGQFLCAAAFTQALQTRFLEARQHLKPIDYCSHADEQRPAEERDPYQACEIKDTVVGQFEGRAVKVKHRLLFVHSSSKAKRQAETRERHLTKIREEFAQVEKILGKYSLKTAEAIRRRLEQARGKYSEGKWFEYELTSRGGQFRLRWWIDAAAQERARQLDGVFVLRTNLPLSTNRSAVLAKYREQSQVERRIHYVKGPLAVTPMFLKNPQRIAGLLCILVLALTVLTLLEREVRRSLAGEPLHGLYGENRPCWSPTAPKLLKAFATLCLVTIRTRSESRLHLAQLTDTQRRILELLNLPDRALQTFKRRCGT